MIWRIALAIACLIWVLVEVRMSLVYLGLVRPINKIEPSPGFARVALTACVRYSLFAIVLLLSSWPNLVTRLLAVNLFICLIDLVIILSGVAPAGLRLTDKGYGVVYRQAAFSLAFSLTYVGVAAYFCGI